MKKLTMILTLICVLLFGVSALADGPVLLVELPEDALMIENVQFEDGDFIQTYQLSGGVRVQFLRYAAFDMTLEDLAEGEWTGYSDAQALEIAEISGCLAQGLKLNYQDETGTDQIVYLITAEAQQQWLLFTAVFPGELGVEEIDATINEWISTMTVTGMDEVEVG